MGTGLLRGEGWALGCNRLAVDDPRTDCRPCRLPSAPGVVAVLDGHLTNHRELRQRMRDRGHVLPEGVGQGAVLPALYAEYGGHFVRHLEGTFAVALMDLRGPGRLVLATDGQGVKTLYHHSTADGAVYFASELPGLVAFPQVPAVPRELGLDDFLASRTPSVNRTLLDGIDALPPGSLAVATGRSGLRPRTAVPSWSAGSPDGECGPRHDVERLLPTDGTACSVVEAGQVPGLTSVMAARHLSELGLPPLHSFQLSWRGSTGQRGFAGRPAARKVRIVRHQVGIDPHDVAALLPRAIWHLGQPFADVAAVGTYALARAVRESGFSVALVDQDSSPSARLNVPSVAVRETLYTPEYREYVRAHRGGVEQLPQGEPAAGALRRWDPLGSAWGVEARVPRPGGRVIVEEEAQTVATALPLALTRESPVLALARDVLEPDSLAGAGMLAPGSVAKLLEQQHRCPTPEGGQLLFSLLVYELWRQELRALRPLPSPVERVGAA